MHERNAYKSLVRKPEGNRPLGRLRHRWEHISMDLVEIGCEIVDWMRLAQDRNKWRALVNTILHLCIP